MRYNISGLVIDKSYNNEIEQFENILDEKLFLENISLKSLFCIFV